MKIFYYKFLLLLILFYSCEPEAIEPKVLALKNQQFSFQQDRGLIYFGVSVIDEYESQPLNSVSLLWYGSSKQNSPVMLNFSFFFKNVILKVLYVNKKSYYDARKNSTKIFLITL